MGSQQCYIASKLPSAEAEPVPRYRGTTFRVGLDRAFIHDFLHIETSGKQDHPDRLRLPRSRVGVDSEAPQVDTLYRKLVLTKPCSAELLIHQLAGHGEVRKSLLFQHIQAAQALLHLAGGLLLGRLRLPHVATCCSSGCRMAIALQQLALPGLATSRLGITTGGRGFTPRLVLASWLHSLAGLAGQLSLSLDLLLLCSSSSLGSSCLGQVHI